MKLRVSSSTSDFSVAWNRAPSSPQLLKAAKAVEADHLGLAIQLKMRNSNLTHTIIWIQHTATESLSYLTVLGHSAT